MIKKLYKKLTEPMPLNEFDNYDEYWKQRGFSTPVLNRAKIAEKYINRNSIILDIACGSGEVIQYPSRTKNPKKIIGIDISKEVIKTLKNKGFEGKVIYIMSNEFIKFLKKEKFDYISMFQIIEHLPNPKKVIKKYKRVWFQRRNFNYNLYAVFLIYRLKLLFIRFPVVIIIMNVKEHLRFWIIKGFKYWSSKMNMKLISYKIAQDKKKKNFISRDLERISRTNII
ncbi:MAG: class I SAM-dependent methyltransferase [Candidatus Woesearchaeota archaeon]